MPPNRGFIQPERLCVTDQLAKALESLRRGGLAILIDDRTRENEGDVVVAAEFVTANAITFMAEHCRTMITIPMTAARLARLGIDLMVKANSGAEHTAFTVSVDYRHGTTTGSSAEDRAKTIRALVDERAKPSDFASPGHVFPLRAHPDGLAARRGHTEGAIELMKLAGLYPAAAISEIQGRHGRMLEKDELLKFARRFNMPVVQIQSIVEHLAAARQTAAEAGKALPAGKISA